jgi:hypothetical protein
MKIFRGVFVAILFALTFCVLARADGLPTLTLDPLGGAITGAAGSTVGWGFTLTNVGTDFAVVTSSDFCVGTITSPCTNSLGTYTDFAGPQFLVVGLSPESTSITQAFNDGLMTGMGSFLINPAATGSVSGEIVLTYDLYTVDPNSASFDPLIDTVSVGNDLTSAASVTVATKSTPEPGSLLLLAIGIAGCLPAKKRLSGQVSSHLIANWVHHKFKAIRGKTLRETTQ